MKLTESRIKEIILEEIQAISEQEEEQENEQPEEKLQTDVERISQLLPKIDTPQKYKELIKVVLKFNPKDMQASQKMSILKEINTLIIELLKDSNY